MTLQEFQQTIAKKNYFDRYWYYGICTLIIILSFVFLFFILTNPQKFNGGLFFHYSEFVFLFLLGTYGLYKLPNRFKIISIENSKSLTDKKIALETFVTIFGSTPKLFNNNYILIRYQMPFWTSSFDIHLYFDEKQICLSVQGHGSADGGFLDLGGTERLRRRAKSEIEFLLA